MSAEAHNKKPALAVIARVLIHDRHCYTGFCIGRGSIGNNYNKRGKGMRKALILISAVLTVGCATSSRYDTELQSWVGKGQAELFGDWGAPTDVIKNEQGATVLLYHKERSYRKGGGSINMGGSMGGASGTPVKAKKTGKLVIKYCDTFFTLDAADKIASYSYEGNECKPSA